MFFLLLFVSFINPSNCEAQYFTKTLEPSQKAIPKKRYMEIQICGNHKWMKSVQFGLNSRTRTNKYYIYAILPEMMNLHLCKFRSNIMWNKNHKISLKYLFYLLGEVSLPDGRNNRIFSVRILFDFSVDLSYGFVWKVVDCIY